MSRASKFLSFEPVWLIDYKLEFGPVTHNFSFIDEPSTMYLGYTCFEPPSRSLLAGVKSKLNFVAEPISQA